MRKILAGLVLCLLALPPLTWAAASVANHVTASTTGAGSLTSPTFTATAGNTLVVGVCSNSTSSRSITTSGSDTVTGIDTVNFTPGLVNTVDFVYIQNIAGGAGYSVTWTPGGGTPAISMEVVELSGVTTTPLDVTQAGINNSPATTTPSTGSSSSTTQADEIAVAWICTDSAANPATVTAGSGWTLSDSQLNGATSVVSGMEYKVLSSTQTVDGTWTTDSATSRTGVVTFKASASTPPTNFYRLRIQP